MAKQTGSNMETVRKSNRFAILKYLNDNGPTSRKDLAAAIGLTPAAVTMICNNLLEEGVVTETGVSESQGKAGRRQIYLDIVSDAAYIISVNIETEDTTIAMCDIRGDIVECRSIITKSNVKPEDFLEEIVGMIEEILKSASRKAKKVVAISVGVPGIVDEDAGIARNAYGIWEDEVDIQGFLAERFDYEICVTNNVSAFAMAEQLYGMGRGHENLMIIKWGPGVGCAMIIDQHIYEGRHGKAAELGHFIVEKNGIKCNCGRRGCLETKIGYQALQKVAKFDMGDFGKCYAKSTGHNREDFDDAIDLFARSVVNSATIMAPNRIVLAGMMFEDEIIRDRMIKCCISYDSHFSENRICYSQLASKEKYIGPVAAYVLRFYFT
ncbi:MAG: ROK family transcriptional regulator [Lachnospiraceae bacterium]|nr:ROK family transcriptional regulator [Lachnospiraceae bacterium]